MIAGTLEFWYRRTYQLAPTDPRFLDSTLEQIETEYWAYHYHANPAREEIEDEDFDLQAEIDRINAENEAAGDGGWETVIDHNSDKA